MPGLAKGRSESSTGFVNLQADQQEFDEDFDDDATDASTPEGAEFIFYLDHAQHSLDNLHDNTTSRRMWTQGAALTQMESVNKTEQETGKNGEDETTRSIEEQQMQKAEELLDKE